LFRIVVEKVVAVLEEPIAHTLVLSVVILDPVPNVVLWVQKDIVLVENHRID
jgi:hypothetical protein